MRYGRVIPLAVAVVLAAPALAPAFTLDPLVAGAPPIAANDDDVHAEFATYAAGLHIADVEAGFGFGPWSYQMQLAFHTTGLVGFFLRGHQWTTVTGSWDDTQPAPHEFLGDGEWRGQRRITLIDYEQGVPEIRTLVPPDEAERQKVPPALQVKTVDTLSAVAQLMRNVGASGRCEGTVRTYDGRRVMEIAAHTVGSEILAPTERSMFSGTTLRCDFEGHMLAGFLIGDTDEADRRPLHGSVWLAQVVPGAPPMPVRMTFQTRWFGDATMYLTKAAPGKLSQRPDN